MIRLILTFLFVAFIGLFIQGGVIKSALPGAVAPDMMVVLVATIGLRYRSIPGLLGAFSLGLLEDFASGQYVGPNAAGVVVVFLLSGLIANRVYADKGVALFLIVFMCSLAKSLARVSMILLYVGRIAPDNDALWVILSEALLSGICAPIVAKLMFGHSSLLGSRRSGRQQMHWLAADR